MVTQFKTLLPVVGTFLRTSAVALIAGVDRRRSISMVNESVKARPVTQQAWITAGVLGAVFALSMVAAQFGWIGILAFWFVIIVVVN